MPYGNPCVVLFCNFSKFFSLLGFRVSRCSIQSKFNTIKVLDKNFIDEANTRSFYEDGSWTGNDKERMYQKARRMMLQKGFSAQNRKKAEETARQQLTKFFRSFGYNNVELTFGK